MLCWDVPEQNPVANTDPGLEQLAQRLKRQSRGCPNCGGQEVVRVEETLVSLDGDRKCLLCGCVWSPRWGRISGIGGIVAGLGLAATGLAVILGRGVGRNDSSISDWVRVDVLVWSAGIIIGFLFIRKGARVLLGKDEGAKILKAGAIVKPASVPIPALQDGKPQPTIEARLPILTERIKADKNHCPNCYGTNFIRTGRHLSLEHRCRDCGCIWTSGPSRLGGVARILGGALALALPVSYPIICGTEGLSRGWGWSLVFGVGAFFTGLGTGLRATLGLGGKRRIIKCGDE